MSLYYLDILQGTVRSCKADGSDERVIVDGIKTLPDGIQVDKTPGTRLDLLDQHGHLA